MPSSIEDCKYWFLHSSRNSVRDLPLEFSTKIEIDDGVPTAFCSTAATSGMTGLVDSISWAFHPIGNSIENPNLSLEYFPEIGGGLAIDCVILSGSPNSNRLETSERFTTSAFKISPSPQSFGISFAAVSSVAILSA